MQFKQGASIFLRDGSEAGHIDRVVIAPKTKTVTHIVIRKGLFFAEDKVVPMKFINMGKAERITLEMDKDKLDELPNFIETHYVMLDEDEIGGDSMQLARLAPAIYWYPPYPESPMVPYVEPPYVPETKVNIPKGTVAVKEGAKVITRDEKHIGDVEQVLTSSQGDRVTHLIISKGLLLKEKKMIPVGWIDQLHEDQVRLLVKYRMVAELPNLQHA